MITINPHINFNGNAEEAFTFYQSIFGGTITTIVRFKDLANDDFQVSETEADKIMRIVLPIGRTVLIGNDVPEYMGRTNENENRSKIAVFTDSKEEADQLFSGLSDGAAIEFPIAEGPGNSYFGGLRDKYGVEWTVELSS